MEQERDFKGVWITKEIWFDNRLNALDKIILVEIDSLDNENGCSASNEYLANFCQCSEAKVSKTIKKLIDLNYIYQQSFNGRIRILRSGLQNFTRQSSKIYEADKEILQANNIYNNKVNKEKNVLKKESPKFVAPTLEEVTEYAKSRGREDLAKKFLEYYTAGNWVDGKGNKVRNWKQKFLTWCGRDNMGLKLEQSFGGKDESILHDRKYSKEEMDSLIADIDKIEI